MRVLALSLVMVAVPPAVASGQSRPEAYSFYTISGSDTIAIEQVVRMPDRIEVDMLLRAEGVRFQFTLEVGSDAAVERVTNRYYRQPADEGANSDGRGCLPSRFGRRANPGQPVADHDGWHHAECTPPGFGRRTRWLSRC